MGIRIAALAAAWAVAAQAWGLTVEDCKKKASDSQRLECYDSLFDRKTTDAEPKVTTRSESPFDRLTLDRRWDLDSSHHDLFLPDTYRPMYVMVANWTNRPNPLPSSPAPGHTASAPFSQRPIEAKYQVSFKSKLWQFDNRVSVWGAYTQSSRWQVYNSPDSRPFRETNYEPEIFVVWPLDTAFGGGRFRMATLGYNHQSNGRALPLSRSWNRIIASAVWEKGDWTVEARPWWRIAEKAADDDNPDIADHVGRAELRITRRFSSNFLSLQMRHSLRARGRGSLQLDWVFPTPWLNDLHWQLQVFHGWGESLIDYNVKQTRVGFGLTIAGWQ